ncbi:hypothetical protein IQ22_01660 [Pseudomonas duriflava]|uniref:Uncharacterized protein n=1 Tax=Pseudomonas duriflava TaxID=459528 RepID=A0A562QG42_9PSED|nr:hypothetical protein IQ22_01660 [Pseudomonas duriflava]
MYSAPDITEESSLLKKLSIGALVLLALGRSTLALPPLCADLMHSQVAEPLSGSLIKYRHPWPIADITNVIVPHTEGFLPFVGYVLFIVSLLSFRVT